MTPWKLLGLLAGVAFQLLFSGILVGLMNYLQANLRSTWKEIWCWLADKRNEDKDVDDQI